MEHGLQSIYTEPAHPENIQAKCQNCDSVSKKMFGPMIFLGKTLGLISWNSNLTPLNLDNNHFWLRVFNGVFKSVIFVIYIITGLYRTRGYILNMHDGVTGAVTDHAINLMELSYGVFLFIIFNLNGKRFITLQKGFRTLDYLFSGTVRNERFVSKWLPLQWLFELVTIISWILYYMYSNQDILITITEILIVSYLSACNSFVCSFFTAAAYLNSELFASLNSKLKIALTSHLDTSSQRLENVRLQYQRLYQLADCIQETFSFLITVQLALITIDVWAFCYGILSATNIDLTNIPPLLTVILFTYYLFITTASADRLTIKARYGVKYLDDVDLGNVMEPKRFQLITLLSNKLSRSPIIITAAGNLFRVNMTTFTTVMATILTYLIVILQFPSTDQCNDMKENVTALNTRS